jgi:regulator of protease activity HflC (stomatin/prohibitin superfamily)
MRAIAIGVALISLAGCSAVDVPAGQEAVLVSHPWFGGGGIQQTPQGVGTAWYGWTRGISAVFIDKRPMQFAVAFDDLMSLDGVPLDFNASLRLRITDSVKMVTKFGSDDKWFDRNLEQSFRNAVRDAVKKRGMNEMAIQASAAEAVDAEVTKAVQDIIKRDDIPVELIDVTLGRANPPDAIKHQRIDTATQEQRIQTERQRKLAEDQRLSAEQSRANADNAYREAMRLTPDQFLQLESIQAMRDVCAGGKCQFVTSGVLPTFGIK